MQRSETAGAGARSDLQDHMPLERLLPCDNMGTGGAGAQSGWSGQPRSQTRTSPARCLQDRRHQAAPLPEAI